MIEFLQNNWLWVLPVVFMGLYLFGGGCGMGRQDKPKSGSDEESKSGEKEELPLAGGIKGGPAWGREKK